MSDKKPASPGPKPLKEDLALEAGRVFTPAVPVSENALFAGRMDQLRRILEYLDSVRHDLSIVLGDFNDWLPGRTVVQALDQRMGRPPRPASFPAFRPFIPLDRIWVHPAGALRCLFAHKTATSRVASDHLPVVADIGPEDLAFHRAIADAAGNEFFPHLLGELAELMRGSMMMGLGLTRAGSEPRRQQVLREHRQIADAIAARDPDTAALCMRFHLVQSRLRTMDEKIIP